MTALVVTLGPPGSGKTRWTMKRFPWHAVVNLDTLRAIAADDPNDQDATADAVFLQHKIVAVRCGRRLMTAVDATNIRTEHRQSLLAHALRNLMYPVAVVFDTPLETCLARNEAREKRVPPHVIHRMWQQFTEEIPAEGPVRGFAQTLRIGPWGTTVHGRTLPAYDRAPWFE
jgi:predicted kinase